jgi:hypothetical protein
MPGTFWPTVQVPIFGGTSGCFSARRAPNRTPTRREGFENRIETLHRVLWTANHQAVPAL